MFKIIFKIVQNDFDLIDIDIHEQTVAHRLAVYLEWELSRNKYLQKNNLSIDCEYNRYTPDNSKSKSSKKLKTQLIRPDIIIHQRGTQKNNLCVFELKKNSRSKRTKNNDIFKLKALTSPIQNFCYQYGIALEYDQESIQITLIMNGLFQQTIHYCYNALTIEEVDKQNKII